ncbi:MAG: nickel-dependent lactate racemase [Bacillota bacterium]
MELPYGSGRISWDVPAGVRVVSTAPPPPARAWESACREALEQPIASPRLEELVGPSSTVAVMVNDNTRWANTRAFLPFILDTLERAGVPDHQVSIIFATGAHRALGEEEQAGLLGEAIAARYRVVNHDCRDTESLVQVGTTRRGTPVWINRLAAGASLRVLTGSIVPHFFAGFGGGRKAMVPGVAGLETITANHRLMLEPGAGTCALEGNPVHTDLEEAASLCGPSFLFNVVLDGHNLLGAFAGDLVHAHRAGCRFAGSLCHSDLEGPADVVVASAGGLPYDLNLYQAQKALDNAARALRPGGTLVLLAECREGWGSATFQEWMHRYPGLPGIQAALQDRFVLGGHKAYAVRKVLEQFRVYLVSSMPATELLAAGITSLESPGQVATGGLTYIMPNASQTVPCLKA